MRRTQQQQTTKICIYDEYEYEQEFVFDLQLDSIVLSILNFSRFLSISLFVGIKIEDSV